MTGISIGNGLGIGDAVQFTSIPENYFRAFNRMLVDVQSHWVWDHNPFITRGGEPSHEIRLWERFLRCKDFKQRWPRDSVFKSIAEHHSIHFGYRVVMNRPRLYRFEDYPFTKRNEILVHAHGLSHGTLPPYVMDHLRSKYGTALIQVGLPSDPTLKGLIRRYTTKTVWDLAKVISEARMFIGVDSGPAWIARCYPDVVTKVVKTKDFDLVPLECGNVNAHWDDRSAMIFNPTDNDVGHTWSFRRI